MKPKRCAVCFRAETEVELKHYESHSACVDRQDCLAARDCGLKGAPGSREMARSGERNRSMFPSDSAKAAHFEALQDKATPQALQPPKPSPAERRGKAEPARPSLDELLWGDRRQKHQAAVALGDPMREALFGKQPDWAIEGQMGTAGAAAGDLTPTQAAARDALLQAQRSGGDVAAAASAFAAAMRR